MAKILALDVETSPIVAYVWQGEVHKARIQNEKILSDIRILSFAARWIGEKQIQYADLRGQINDKGEKILLKRLWDLMNGADVVVAHNGQAFDIPTIFARFAAFELSPPSPSGYVDTYLEARKQFKFTSNKLEFLGRALGCPIPKYLHGKFPGLELWKECLNDNPRAWNEMKKYNMTDIEVLEYVYLKIRAWMGQHPNLALIDSGRGCPKCGKPLLVKSGIHIAKSLTYQRYRCTKCGAWTRDTQAIKTMFERKNKAIRWEPN